MWVQRGYDPRLDPEARRLQGLECPIPTAWCARGPETVARLRAFPPSLHPGGCEML